MRLIGVDPGCNGAACLMDETGAIIDVLEFNKNSEADIAAAFKEWHGNASKTMAYIENVHSMPKQGVASSFKFGRGFGFLIGVLTTANIPFQYVTPQSWQKAMQCQSKGDKNVTKSAAQRLFPDRKITHACADAILIAEYGRRVSK